MSDRERGFALLLALWSMVLLALLTSQLLSAGRTEVQLAASLRTQAELEAVADGLLYETIFRLMDRPGLPANGQDRPAPVPRGLGVVRVADLAGRINPNTASESLLRALLENTGVSRQAAFGLAAAIMDWRTPGERPRPGGAKAARYAAAGYGYGPPGAPFESLDELGRVLGMTEAILARLKPHMTVLYPGNPATAAADPLVRRVLEEAGGDALADDARAEGTYARIEVEVTRSGASFTRRADVWAGQGIQQGRYLVLRWEVPNDE